MADKTYQVQFIDPTILGPSVSEFVSQTWTAEENDGKKVREIFELCSASYYQVAKELSFLARLFQVGPRTPGAEFNINTDSSGHLYLIGSTELLDGHETVLVPGTFEVDPDEDDSLIWVPDIPVGLR